MKSAIALVIIALTAIGFTKGSARMLFGLIALCAGALIAYWGFKRGGAIAESFTGKGPIGLRASTDDRFDQRLDGAQLPRIKGALFSGGERLAPGGQLSPEFL